MIEIMNMRSTKPSQPYDVKIDRTGPLGNSFYMRSEAQRNAVCDQYAEWLISQISHKNQKVCTELNRLYELHRQYEQLRLFCWCAPKRCHGESIKAALEKVGCR
jgi:hypothetical protein